MQIYFCWGKNDMRGAGNTGRNVWNDQKPFRCHRPMLWQPPLSSDTAYHTQTQRRKGRKEGERDRKCRSGSVSVPAQQSWLSASRYSGCTNWQFSQKCYPQRQEAVSPKKWLSGQINMHLHTCTHIHSTHMCTDNTKSNEWMSELLRELVFETEMKADRSYFSGVMWILCVCNSIFTLPSPLLPLSVLTSCSNIQQ